MNTFTKAVLEALLFLQIFLAAYRSIPLLQGIFNHSRGISAHFLIIIFLIPILNLITLFAAILQFRLKSAATKKQTIVLELIKSGIVTALWVWLLVENLVGPQPEGTLAYMIVANIVSFLQNVVIFYPTLVVALRGSGPGTIRLGDEGESLLPQ